MGTPFIGEIRMVGFDFNPKDWAECNGQLLQIGEYSTLFALIGNEFGGNGQTNFALPDLRGRVPIHPGNGISQGEVLGSENVTLTEGNLPSHNHIARASSQPADVLAAGVKGRALGTPQDGVILYTSSTNNLTTMYPDAVTIAVGENQPHNNMQPSGVVKYVIALQGVFPPRN